MLIVPLACPTCGAPGRHVEGSLFALCEHCGAVIARHREAVAGAMTFVRAAYLAVSSEAAARLIALMNEQEAARVTRDRPRYEAIVTESLLLELAADPSRVPVGIAVAEWVKAQVELRSLVAFEVAPMPQLPVAELEANPIVVGRAHLATLRSWTARIPGRVADGLAVDCYRVAIAGAAPMLSAIAITEALSVLGATEQTNCRVCGGVHEANAAQCPWCRSSIDLELVHPWVEALARITSAPLAVPRPPLERAQIALQILASNVMMTKKSPPPALVEAYLRASIPDVPRSEIDAAYAQLRAIGMPI